MLASQITLFGKHRTNDTPCSPLAYICMCRDMCTHTYKHLNTYQHAYIHMCLYPPSPSLNNKHSDRFHEGISKQFLFYVLEMFDFILWLCAYCLHVCAPCVCPGRPEDSPLKLESQMAVTQHVGSMKQTQVFWKSGQCS